MTTSSYKYRRYLYRYKYKYITCGVAHPAFIYAIESSITDNTRTDEAINTQDTSSSIANGSTFDWYTIETMIHCIFSFNLFRK